MTKSVTQETVDLVTFTEEIVNGKLLFLCNGWTFVWITHSFSLSLCLSLGILSRSNIPILLSVRHTFESVLNLNF